MGSKAKDVPQSQHQGSDQKRHEEDRHEEERIDKGVEDTFPASDPTSVGGATRIESDDEVDAQEEPSAEGGASEDGGGSDDTPHSTRDTRRSGPSRGQ